jgi:hypothetical protein
MAVTCSVAVAAELAAAKVIVAATEVAATEVSAEVIAVASGDVSQARDGARSVNFAFGAGRGVGRP